MSSNPVRAESTLPPDDLTRNLTLISPEDKDVPHIGMVGNTYTTLLASKDTAGKYCVIDMQIPPGGGPPPHRHDFEETFIILEGEIDATFRGVNSLARAGQTLHIPANAPHQFRNHTEKPARLLCICAPAGQEEFFAKVAVPVASRTAAPPKLDEKEEAEFRKKAGELAPTYKTELLRKA